MKPVVTSGDITLAARPATRETFASFGDLLSHGDCLALGKRARVLVSVSEGRPGPRRITHLSRYPEARRGVVSATAGPMWLVVLGAGDRPSGAPAAFTIAPGSALVLGAGVWHAGPMLLDEGVLVEMLEAPSGVDRLDRVPLGELVGADGARVLLPDEPGAPVPGLDLSAPNAVLLDAALAGRLRVGCLAFEHLEPLVEPTELTHELTEVADGLRGMWARVADLEEVPGVGAMRALFAALGMDPAHIKPPSEALLAEVLAGRPLPRTDPLSDALMLASLRMGVPLAAYDTQALSEQVLVRIGAGGEDYRAGGRRRIGLEGRPVLCDRDGPFGSPAGNHPRARISPSTREALVVLFLAPGVEAKAADALLDGVARMVVRFAGGVERGRVVVG